MPRLETKKYRVSSLTQNSDIPHLSFEKKPHQSKSDIDDFEGLFMDGVNPHIHILSKIPMLKKLSRKSRLSFLKMIICMRNFCRR